jgi:hypothetical protein
MAMSGSAARMVVEMEPVHGNDGGRTFGEQVVQLRRQRRLAGAGRSGNGHDEAPLAAGALENGGHDVCYFGHRRPFIPDLFPGVPVSA